MGPGRRRDRLGPRVFGGADVFVVPLLYSATMRRARSHRTAHRYKRTHPTDTMNALKIFGIALIVAGMLALVYRGFSYTKETHETKLGPLQFTVKEKETIEIPVWAGVGAIVVGVGLILVGQKKR
jgi:heme/copper-type cytochrome/quinol oxidase subunit 2